MTSLLKKDIPFKWTQKQQTAFDSLKERLILAPILSYPDFELPFILYTDASGTGLGAVLSQKQKDGKEHVISYASRSLNVHEQNYPVTDQECLAIVWALKKFSHYLELQHFTVVTDHAALKWMKTSKLPKGRRARWMMEIQQYKFDVQHRPGKANANADALSRMYEGEVQYTSCFMMDYEYPPVNPQKRQKIDEETAIYITLSELITDVELPYEGDTEEEQEAPVASSSKPSEHDEPEKKVNDNWNSANTLVNDTWNWNDNSAEKLDKGKAKEISPRLSPDRKSTRLNSSHSQISYAVFCLKKKKKNTKTYDREYSKQKITRTGTAYEDAGDRPTLNKMSSECVRCGHSVTTVRRVERGAKAG